MKKAKWLISADSVQYKSVLLRLKRFNCEIVSELDVVHVIVIKANEKEVLKYRNIMGILSIEKEGQVSI